MVFHGEVMQRLLISILGLMLVLGAMSTAQANEPRVFITGHIGTMSSHFAVGVRSLCRSLQARNQNVLCLQVPNSAWGGEVEMIRKVRSGELHAAMITTAPLAAEVSDLQVFDVPFLFASVDEARTAIDGALGEALADQISGADFELLGWGENGLRHLTNSLRPVRRPQDLAGMRLRVQQNPTHLEAFTLLGAQPAPLPFPELRAALRDKRFDGQENPIGLIISARLYTQQNHLSLTGHLYSPIIWIVNRSYWNGLSATEQQIWREAAIEARDAQRGAVDMATRDGLEMLRARGIAIEEQVDLEAFRQPMAQLRERVAHLEPLIAVSIMQRQQSAPRLEDLLGGGDFGAPDNPFDALEPQDLTNLLEDPT